jgi:hypothetical protein
MLKSKFSLSRHFEYANEQITYHFWLWPAAHALTGCDTTSSFFGIGKKSMLKALKEKPNQISELSRIENLDFNI